MDEVISPTMTVKVAGHQWYWSNDLLNLCNGESAIQLTSPDVLSGTVVNTSAAIKLILLNEDIKDSIRPLTHTDIPLVVSNNHKQTLEVLNQALDSDLFSTEVRDYISNIRGQQWDSLCFITDNGDLVLPEGKSLGHSGRLPELNRVSGIYSIVDTGTDDSYIGSSVDLAYRLRGHRDVGTSSSSLGTQHLLYSRIQEQGANAFTFHQLHGGTNFLAQFTEDHPDFNLTSKEIDLLTAFTKYELALTEQSYLNKFQPTLNGRYIATTSTHPHLLTPSIDSTLSSEPVYPVEELAAPEVNTVSKVDISNWVKNPNLKVQVLDVDNNILGSFQSLRKAADALQTNHIKLSRYAKSADSVYIDYLDIKVNISVDGFTKEGAVVHPSAKSHAPLVHNLELPAGRICAISSDLRTLFGDYQSV